MGQRRFVSHLPDSELLALDPLELRDRLVAEIEERFAGDDDNGAEEVLEKLRFATIDETTLARTDAFLRRLARGRRLVATSDPQRQPADDEVVIVYGNYPHVFDNVVVNNPIRRHVASFGELPYDVFESDHRWERVSRIFVLNAAERSDRRDAVLRELAMARAPLDRVERIPATHHLATGRREVDGAIGCLESHLAALRRAAASGCEHALVLEDDFCFTSDLDAHLDDLAAFLVRGDDYLVCLLATSKHGRIEPRDGLVSVSRQPVTNAAGYLVSRTGLDRLIEVQQHALERLLATGDPTRWAADRSWAVLQPSDKFLVFRRKMGFQAASFSDIEGRISRYLD